MKYRTGESALAVALGMAAAPAVASADDGSSLITFKLPSRATVEQLQAAGVDLGERVQPNADGTVEVDAVVTPEEQAQLAAQGYEAVATVHGPDFKGNTSTGSKTLYIGTQAGGDVGGSVPATLSLTLGPAASFGAFTPGADKSYSALTTATVTSTAADAALSVSDPGHLANGAFTLPEPLQVTLTPSAWSGPVSNAGVAIGFAQHIGANDALRTGSYSKTLTFTLSTTNP